MDDAHGAVLAAWAECIPFGEIGAAEVDIDAIIMRDGNPIKPTCFNQRGNGFGLCRDTRRNGADSVKAELTACGEKFSQIGQIIGIAGVPNDNARKISAVFTEKGDLLGCSLITVRIMALEGVVGFSLCDGHGCQRESIELGDSLAARRTFEKGRFGRTNRAV